MHLFCFCAICSLIFFINIPSHTMSRNSNSTLMSMAADLFGSLCYNAYGLVINAIQKPVYVKLTTIQTVRLCKCYGIRQLFCS